MSSFAPRVSPPERLEEPAYWFIFRDQKLLVETNGARATIPQALGPEALGLSVARQQYLGYLYRDQPGEPEGHCFSAEVTDPDQELPPGTSFEGLRALYGRLEDDYFRLAGLAVQIVEWDRTHQFCGRCGRPTRDQPHERAKICPNCGLTNFPRLAPAIIVRVQRCRENGEREILLARNRRFPSGFYSVLAGFVEPGETLEECVVREVAEESGIAVKDIRYFGSQPWPFPHSLMIAFTAEYAGGDVAPNPEEMDDVRWFTADNLPDLPMPISIARRLIDGWLAESGISAVV